VNRHFALACRLSAIFSENRHPLFGIVLYPRKAQAARQHASFELHYLFFLQAIGSARMF
jgi:hypothetical protein